MELETITRDELNASDTWTRSVGKTLIATHYRQKDGNGHAVCRPGSDECYVHYDVYSAHQNPVKHLLKDAPEVVLTVLGAAVIGPKAIRKVRKFL